MKTQSGAVGKWACATSLSFIVQLHLIVARLGNFDVHHYSNCLETVDCWHARLLHYRHLLAWHVSYSILVVRLDSDAKIAMSPDDHWHVSNPSMEYLFQHQAVTEEKVNQLRCLFCIFWSRVLSFLQLHPFSARHATQPCSTHSALSGGNSFPLQPGEHLQWSLTTPVS